MSQERTYTKSTLGETHDDAAKNAVARSSVTTRAKSLWAKYGVDRRMYRSIFKSAIAPTIALAAFQATPWADYYTTLGYLTIIMTILTVVIVSLERSTHLQRRVLSLTLLDATCKIHSNHASEHPPPMCRMQYVPVGNVLLRPGQEWRYIDLQFIGFRSCRGLVVPPDLLHQRASSQVAAVQHTLYHVGNLC